MHVTVCIPAIRPETTEDAVRSIMSQTYQDWDLLVVGQGSDDGVRSVAARHSSSDPRVGYVHLAGRGTCKARNEGFRRARGPLVAFIDDDCEAASDWLDVLVTCFREEPRPGLVGGALALPKVGPTGMIARTTNWVPCDVTYDPAASPRQPPRGWDWIGCNFAIAQDVVRKVGGFDESLGPGSGYGAAEDTDYKLRLERAGVRMRATPNAVVYHTHGARTGLREVMRNQRNYARGMGALTAKLTLMGDDRGGAWLEKMRRDCVKGLPFTPARAIGWRRWRLYHAAYRECLRRGTADGVMQAASEKMVESFARSRR